MRLVAWHTLCVEHLLPTKIEGARAEDPCLSFLTRHRSGWGQPQS